MFKYSISIKWSDEDGGFIATVPELEGLSAFGETQEEAARELLEAGEAFIETMKKAGDALPEPSKATVYSGQTRLRMPKTLHARLAVEAEKENVSLNTYVVSLLSERHGVREAVSAIRTETGRIRSATESSASPVRGHAVKR
jgi:predicted RNase H-like HicB family nuclease